MNRLNESEGDGELVIYDGLAPSERFIASTEYWSQEEMP